MVLFRRHSSKFRPNCALLVTALKFGKKRETIKGNIFSYRTTFTEVPFPWKLHLNALYLNGSFLYVLREIQLFLRLGKQ